jgi:O-acetyl-ADP-ribose deacetylase (regulator of RNase III)
MNTPENITHLKPGEVFVFGSNAEGLHGGGAARVAHERFGAIWGVGEGHTGQSYALPTTSGLADLHAAVGRFLAYASAHSSITFYVTRIGCGIAGHTPEQVAPAFTRRPPNVIVPADFQAIIERNQK